MRIETTFAKWASIFRQQLLDLGILDECRDCLEEALTTKDGEKDEKAQQKDQALTP